MIPRIEFNQLKSENAALKARLERLEKAAREVLANHDKRMGMYMDAHDQPIANFAMSELRVVLEKKP